MKAKQTYEERLITGLLALGWRVDTTDRSHYSAFVKDGQASKLFVGKAGALRVGRCASNSFSVGDPTNQATRYLTVLNAGTVKESTLE